MKQELVQIRREIEIVNQSFTASLEEGVEETLTLHRLGVFAVLGNSIKTTSCVESRQRDGGGVGRGGRLIEEIDAETQEQNYIGL